MMAKRTGRKKSQLPELYYEGYLEKMSIKDQTSQKLWTCLCGNALFFFSKKRDVDYADKVDLSALSSVEDDNSPDCKADSTRFTVQLKSGSIKFTAPNAESRELWKGFIHAVGQLSVPSFLNLLPGQIHIMEDVVEREKERLANTPPPATPPPATPPPAVTTQSDMPACFFEVPRLEAELLLEREASKGNLLVRPGRSINSYTISVRMELAGTEFKHYRVLCKENGSFCIDVKHPVFGDTLQDVINYLVEKSDGNFTPLIIEEHYDQKISFISTDNESGEKIQETLPSFAPAPPPRKHVNFKLTAPEAKAVGEKSPLADKTMTAPRKILMPPSPAPRKVSMTTTTTNQGDSRKLSDTEEQRRLHLSAICELKLKLEQKLKIQD